MEETDRGLTNLSHLCVVDLGELVWQGAGAAEVCAGRTDQRAAVDPAVEAHVDVEQLAGSHTHERLLLHPHHQPLIRAGHLQKHNTPTTEA